MDIDQAQQDGAQDTERMTDPRAALAEAIGCYGEPGKDAELARQYLAERGVRLVTEERLAAANRDARYLYRRSWATMTPDEQAAAIFAALSGES
jgi:hypothetical protein